MNRPVLDRKILIKDFNNWYWYKSELVNFCRKYKLGASGQKLDLFTRIKVYLKAGKILKNNEQVKKSSKQKLPKNINEFLPPNFTCSELYRKYFKSVIGSRFHFTAYMMNYVKNKPKITFQKCASEWIAEEKRRKNKKYKPPIMKSCEYNQYIRDFFENNPERNLKEAIKCWKRKKNLPGKHKYEKKDLAALR